MSLSSSARFSGRVANYVRCRPSYPSEALQFILSNPSERSGESAVDLGSGTGIWSQILLDAGFNVTGVEPNPEMRQAAEETLGDRLEFQSVDGTSSATGLAGGCADLITAAQAFHWFDVLETRRECHRLLRPEGRVAILFNERVTKGTDFLEAYEALLQRFASDYNQVNHTNVSEEAFAQFYGHTEYRKGSFPNHQHFDEEGLEGRLLSSSYAPAKGESGHEEMLKALHSIFRACATEGQVRFEYRTLVYVGPLV